MRTIKELLLWTEAGYGNKEAIADLDRGVRWTYADLNSAARSICAGYAAGGVGQGDRVGWLAMAPGADVTALSFGARKMGAIPVAMNARASAERIAWMIDNIGIKALSYTSETAELLARVQAVGIPSVRHFIALDEPLQDSHVTLTSIYADHAAAGEPSAIISPDDIAFVVYTSGSTGRPKPVMHSESRWVQQCTASAYMQSLYHEDRFVLLFPPHFVGWAYFASSAIAAAATQVCVRFDPTRVARVIAEESGTHLVISPSMVRILREEYKRDPALFAGNQVRVGMLGGERITPDVLDAVSALFPRMQRYASLGASEAAPLHTGVGNPRLAQDDGRLVGRPLPGVTVELRDADTGAVIQGPGTGELFVRGPVAVGIWGDAEATAKNFPDGWWRSGDMLTRDEDGYFSIAGRADNVFKSGAIKISCEEVEAVLKTHPLVLDAIVVPAPDPRFGFTAHAFVRHDGELDGETLAAWWRERPDADPYARPRHWTLMGREPFPMVTAVKVDRHGLRERARQQRETKPTEKAGA